MKNKRGVLYWLRVVLCILCIGWTLYRCSEEFIMSASADEVSNNYVDLTPAQTLALYGTQIQGLLVTEFQQPARSITFDYAFPLSSVGYMDYGGGFSAEQLDNEISISSNSVKDEVVNYMSSADGLVYIASASQWGGTKVQGYNKYGSNPVQLHCPFSITLNDIGGIQQALSYSTYPRSPQSNGVGTSGLPYVTDNTITWLFGADQMTLDSVPGQFYGSIQRAARYPMPTYAYYEYTYDTETGFTTYNPIDTAQVQQFSGFYINTEEQPDPFDCTGLTIDAYGITSAQANSNDLWLIVQCPRLFAYEPPVITTTRPPETVPAATYPVATMPPDSTDVPANVINQNLITQNYQLNLIIGQLNLIYNQLKANGQLQFDVDLGWDPDLQDGESIAFYGTDIENQMHNIMTTYTLSGNPELNDSNNFVKYAFMAFFSENWLAGLGLFALGLSLATWIIFSGRGG